MKIAAITMVYNEGHALRRWVDYYSRQLGAENCFIVDHGSDDGSTAGLGPVNVIRIPRSPQDNERRTKSISQLANSLLCWYDYVFYVDGDEFLVADPRKYSGLLDYCEAVRPEYITSVGINVMHSVSEEADLVPGVPVLHQRSHGMFVSAMCKPNLTAVPVSWSPGFHYRDRPAIFGDLFLFHLRYADVRQGLARLQITREMPWHLKEAGAHQRLLDEEWLGRVKRWTSMPVVHDVVDPVMCGEELVVGDRLGISMKDA